MSEEIKIKNQTTYDYAAYLELNKFNLYTRRRASLTFLIVCIVILMLSGIFLIALDRVVNGIFYMCIAAFFIVFTIMLPHIQSKKVYRSDNLLNQDGLHNEFLFYENELEVINQFSNTKLEYEKIYQAYETNDYFYLFMNKIQTFIVEKSGFESTGDMEKFRELIKEKLGEKYIKKCK